MKTQFKTEKMLDENTGAEVDTLVKIVVNDAGSVHGETLCDVIELDNLFNVCEQCWGTDWSLEKVKQAVLESQGVSRHR